MSTTAQTPAKKVNFEYTTAPRETWQGFKWTAYITKIGNCTLSGRSLEELEQMVANHKPVDNSGAAAWYGQGRYMGD